MRNSFLTIVFLFVAVCTANAQGIVGKWKTIDDSTGKEKSIVEIYEKDGKYYGKVAKLLNPSKPNPKCEKCEGDEKGAPIEGLVIIKGLQKKGEEYTGGKITDPESGKQYKCTVKLNGKDKLDVRGYVGISLMGRTQTWVKAN
ncbi:MULTISPECIES: DUF2147 domain-containing protein [Myroides]|uniref:DUF2147 domain-containing protein n=1 Tax=Myroides albus TaxID=2562892 RepID=A0A6I3LKP1_9FLAO|nr:MULTISPECIES: DUF2147 domain-containing protein [Myroides]MTG98384.1 DUF2147 domain-containing protein [Myroides albus]MVX35735.1 DUF2147 domain-containing protein [Myroides sp. LoEW2-1]UVD80377.1 DUF2147 domain-containing protein [Myroides albus]